MPIPQYQKERCLQVMEKIFEQNISKMFLHPVNPETDHCADYFTKISHPMDLTTSKEKLQNDLYETIEDWKNDIELIWTNAFTYHGTQVLISLLAKELQTLFKNLTINLSSDSVADWNAQFEKLKSETNQAIKNFPKYPQTKQQKLSRTSSSTLQNSPQLSRPTSYATDQNHISEQKQSLSKDEITVLTNQVNSIEDQDSIQQIIDLVKRLEPQSSFQPSSDEEIEENAFVLEIEKLKNSTLVELKKLITRLLHS